MISDELGKQSVMLSGVYSRRLAILIDAMLLSIAVFAIEFGWLALFSAEAFELGRFELGRSELGRSELGQVVLQRVLHAGFVTALLVPAVLLLLRLRIGVWPRRTEAKILDPL